MVDVAHEIQAVLLVKLAHQLRAAIGAVHHVPLVRVVERHGEAGEEHTRRHTARPIDGEQVHAIQHTIAHGVHQLEIAGNGAGRERLDLQFAARDLADLGGPFLEDLVPCGARAPMKTASSSASPAPWRS